MDTKLDDNVLMDMVFRSLCRVLKNRKIYHIFRCFVGGSRKPIYGKDFNLYGNLNCMQPYLLEAQRGDNPFCNAANKNDIFDILIHLLGKDNMITKDNNSEVGKVQMRITQFLNTLLHSCVERAVNNFSEVEHIGQETFEMVCKKIYGDNFVDETEKNIPTSIKELMNAQREYLENHELKDPRRIIGDPRFIQFLKNKGIIDGHGDRRRSIEMMPPIEETLTNYEWHHPTDHDLFDDDEDFEWLD